MSKRLILLLAIVLLGGLVLAACGGTEPAAVATEAPPTAAPAEPTMAPEPTPEPPMEEEAFRVGMISDVGGIDDASFNENTWKGLQDAVEQLGVQAAFLESQSQADYEPNIIEFAEQGYDMIVMVGFLGADAVYKIAPQYPDIMFAGIDIVANPDVPNLKGTVFNVDEASFPVGFLAAAMADQTDPDDPQVGYIAGMQIPPVEQFIVAYEEGVKYYNNKYGKDVQFVGVYIGDFEAPDQGKIQGTSLIDEGVDIILGVGGKTGNGGIAAAKEAGKLGVGVDVDQYFTLPNEKDILVTSTVKRLDNTVFAIVEEAANGNFVGGENYVATLANGGVGVAPYHDFEGQVPDNIKADMEEIQQMIVAGELCTGWPEPCPEAMTSDVGTPDNPIKVLFVPSVDTQAIVSGGEVMRQALEEATGLSYEVVVPTSYAATIEEMCAAPDSSIGFIPGLGYVLANQLCGVDVAFKAVRFGWDVYWAQLIVQRDSDIQSVADLEGKTWAYPDAGSTSGYLAVLPMLAEAGIEIPEGNRVEAGGHTGVVRAIYNGEADFGSTFFSPPLSPGDPWAPGDEPDIPADIVDTCAPNDDGSRLLCGPNQEWRVLDARAGLREEAPDVVQRVRILTISPEIPNDTLSFSPDFPAALRAQIAEALVAFSATEAWNESIGSQDFYGWTGINVATDEEYDVVRQMIELSGLTLEDLGQ